MQLHQAIFKIEKALPKEWCKNFIKYMDLRCTSKAQVLIDGKSVEDTSQRNVYDHGLDPEKPGEEIYIKILLDLMQKALTEYCKTFTYLREVRAQDINLLKYEKGNFYNTHVDAFHTVNRQLSFIINLNEDYTGGNLVFHNPMTKQPYSQTNLKEGDLIMFPSNFLYPHKILPITEGTRYSIVSWYS